MQYFWPIIISLHAWLASYCNFYLFKSTISVLTDGWTAAPCIVNRKKEFLYDLRMLFITHTWSHWLIIVIPDYNSAVVTTYATYQVNNVVIIELCRLLFHKSM